MFLGAIILNLLSSYFIASIFGNFLIIFVAFFALVVLNMEILSLFSAINETNAFILVILNFILSLTFFKIKKAKPLKLNFDFKRFKNSLMLDKHLFILFLGFLFLLLVSLFLDIIMPSLEPDSQTYHFIRAYEFSQQGSLAHIMTNDIRALVMPINSEVLYAWMYLFKKNFYGYGIVSFCGFILAICSMWNICEKLKFAFRKRLYAIFIFSSFSAIIMQMQSLQTDLVVGSLFLASLALFINNSLFFSSLSLALAMGTKTTGVIGIIAFFIILIAFEILIEKNKKLDKTKRFSLFLIINFLIFSSYNYFSNLFHYGSPFSSRVAYLGHVFWGGIKGYIANLIHFFFQSFDFTGFKWGFYLNDEILTIKQKVFEIINIPPEIGCNVEQDKVNIAADEQVVGFGILGFLVFLPMIFLSNIKIFFNKNKKTIFLFILSIAFIINILVLARTTAYMVFSIRFIVAYVSLSSLVLIYAYKKRGFLRYIILFFCLFNMILLSTHNKRMPIPYVVDYLKEVNYNLEAFEDGCFNQKVIDIHITSPRIYKTIKEKYQDKKRILFLKKLSSSALYLKKLEKEGFKVDFLPVGKFSEEKIENYDLIILEDKVQNDNIFSTDEIKINYKVDNEKVTFNDKNAFNCFYYFESHLASDKKEAVERICFSWEFLIKNKKVKLDYSDFFNLGEENKNTEIFYFVRK